MIVLEDLDGYGSPSILLNIKTAARMKEDRAKMDKALAELINISRPAAQL